MSGSGRNFGEFVKMLKIGNRQLIFYDIIGEIKLCCTEESLNHVGRFALGCWVVERQEARSEARSELADK